MHIRPLKEHGVVCCTLNKFLEEKNKKALERFEESFKFLNKHKFHLLVLCKTISLHTTNKMFMIILKA